MQETLRRMREKRATGDRGFTLIELLVVVVIIGVLVAIAIPLYLNYTKGASNKTAQSDVRAAVSAIEQYYTENSNSYPSGTKTSTGGALDLGNNQKATVSSGNELVYAASGSGYVICGRNTSAGQVYKYDSNVGGSVSTFNGGWSTCTSSTSPAPTPTS